MYGIWLEARAIKTPYVPFDSAQFEFEFEPDINFDVIHRKHKPFDPLNYFPKIHFSVYLSKHCARIEQSPTNSNDIWCYKITIDFAVHAAQ